MKKNVMRIAALLLLLSLLLSLTACGENAKRQEAVDAYSKAADSYNVMADKMNNYADVIDEVRFFFVASSCSPLSVCSATATFSTHATI